MSEKNWADVKIGVRRDTHKRLKQYGKMGETFDSLINRLLDEIEKE